MPLITVVICTHNRANILEEAIESVLDQREAEREAEVVVVDNRSTDETRTVVERTGARYLFEPVLGHSVARNTGWRNARGEYVAYLDDDALANAGWLRAIARAFESVTPMPACVGGPVEPIWEAERPRWLSDQLSICLGVIHWSERPHEIRDPGVEFLPGGNIAFRTEALARVGGFSPRLGRVGGRLLSADEILVQEQLIKSGETCYYDPAITVRHRVPAERLEQRWFLSRYYWQGVSEARMQLIREQPSITERLAIAARKTAKLLGDLQRVRRLLSATTDPEQFTARCFDLIAVGQIAGLVGAPYG